MQELTLVKPKVVIKQQINYVWEVEEGDKEERELHILSKIDYQDNGRLDIESGNVEVDAIRQS